MKTHGSGKEQTSTSSLGAGEGTDTLEWDHSAGTTQSQSRSAAAEQLSKIVKGPESKAKRLQKALNVLPNYLDEDEDVLQAAEWNNFAPKIGFPKITGDVDMNSLTPLSKTRSVMGRGGISTSPDEKDEKDERDQGNTGGPDGRGDSQGSGGGRPGNPTVQTSSFGSVGTTALLVGGGALAAYYFASTQ